MHEKNARTLALLIRLCDDLAWGRPADADALFALTREGSSSPELERLAEAFGMMIVKVEAREFQRAELLEKVEQLSQELEKSRLITVLNASDQERELPLSEPKVRNLLTGAVLSPEDGRLRLPPRTGLLLTEDCPG